MNADEQLSAEEERELARAACSISTVGEARAWRGLDRRCGLSTRQEVTELQKRLAAVHAYERADR
jgi:hypothetical protein